MRLETAAGSLCLLLVLTILAPFAASIGSGEQLVVEGTVYDATSGKPVEGAFVVYYMVFKDSEKHVGVPLDCAYTDAKGHYEIVLTDGEQQMNSAAKYSLEEIRKHGFMVAVFKDGYMRNYAGEDLENCIYFEWGPTESVRVVDVKLYKSLPYEEIVNGNVRARYYYGFMRPAAKRLADDTKYYLELLKEKLGLELLNEIVIIDFEMGKYEEHSGAALVGVEKPNKIVLEWYPWLADKERNRYAELLVAHELVHLFQYRLNNKGMLVRLGNPWIMEAEAVAVSKALVVEEGVSCGKSFYDQAYDSSVSLPSGYEDYLSANIPYPELGKLFSKIVVEHKKKGESEWDFVKRFMQNFEFFAKDGCIGEHYMKAYGLSDYEVVLLLSMTACENLTDVFLTEYGFPSQELLQQKVTYAKFLRARLCMQSLASSSVYEEFKQHYYAGVDKAAFRKYAEAEQEFSKAIELGSCPAPLLDPIMAKCIVEHAALVVKLFTEFEETLRKYVVYVDGTEVRVGERVPLPIGLHKIEVFYGRLRVYVGEVQVTEEGAVVTVEIEEHVLQVDLGEYSGEAEVLVYSDSVLVDRVRTARPSVRLVLPEGTYTVVVEAGETRVSERVSLERDSKVDFAGKIEGKTKLTVEVTDSGGDRLRATVELDGQAVSKTGYLETTLKPGSHSLRILVGNVVAYEEQLEARGTPIRRHIVVRLHRLRVEVSQRPLPLYTCTVTVSDSEGRHILSARGSLSTTLPEGPYVVTATCGPYSSTSVVLLAADSNVTLTVDTVKSEHLYLALALVAIAAIALAFKLRPRRGS